MALAPFATAAHSIGMTFHWVDGGMWIAVLLPLLWMLLLALGVILLVRLVNRGGPSQPPQWGGPPQSPPQAGDSAEEILRRRYAAGEIDEEEYRRRLDVLKR